MLEQPQDASPATAAYRRCVEWLGAPWGHAVAPSTPVQDYRLHVQAWQHHFAALFGARGAGAACGASPRRDGAAQPPRRLLRVRPHALGLRLPAGCWCRSTPSSAPEDGGPVSSRTCRTGWLRELAGREPSIIAIIKTQGSDTKLVGQMQPYYEAKGLSRQDLAGKSVPPLVTQIADGENGGVMMNEFPSKYLRGHGARRRAARRRR